VGGPKKRAQNSIRNRSPSRKYLIFEFSTLNVTCIFNCFLKFPIKKNIPQDIDVFGQPMNLHSYENSKN